MPAHHALLKLLSANGETFCSPCPSQGLGLCLFFSLPIPHTSAFCTLFLTTEVFSTLHHTGFEAHDILRNHHHPGKSAKCQWTDPHQWALVSTDEQDDGEEVAPVPLTSVFPGLFILSSALEKLKPGPGLPCSESFCGCEQSQPLFLVNTLAYDSLHHEFSSHSVLFIVSMSLWRKESRFLWLHMPNMRISFDEETCGICEGLRFVISSHPAVLIGWREGFGFISLLLAAGPPFFPQLFIS